VVAFVWISSRAVVADWLLLFDLKSSGFALPTCGRGRGRGRGRGWSKPPAISAFTDGDGRQGTLQDIVGSELASKRLMGNEVQLTTSELPSWLLQKGLATSFSSLVRL